VVRRLGVYDPDADGPVTPQLYVGYQQGDRRGVCRLSGADWSDVGTGLYHPLDTSTSTVGAMAFMTVDPDSSGPEAPILFIGGDFTHANGVPTEDFAMYRLNTDLIPVLTTQPAPAQGCTGSVLEFHTNDFGIGASYQWQVEDPTLAWKWRSITDGDLIVSGQPLGAVTGATTPHLLFSPSAVATTAFRCVVTGPCGATLTRRATATAQSCCGSADFNGDGDFGTDQDIEAFFTCLAGQCCPTCGTSDFNGDSDFGTDQDIEAFFRVLAGQTC
jgi:hypothetical protein